MKSTKFFVTFIFGFGFLVQGIIDAQDIGKPCMVKNKPGICELHYKCKSEYAKLLSNSYDVEICGFEDTHPVLCCPKIPVKNVMNHATTTPDELVWGIDPPKTVRPTTTTTSRPITPVTSPTSTTSSWYWSMPEDFSENNIVLSNKKDCKPAKKMCEKNAGYVYELVKSLGAFEEYVNVSTCAIGSKKLIVGGVKAAVKEMPHMVSVGYSEDNVMKHRCGGTLIADRWVLTAAHCLYSKQGGNSTWARLGVANLNSKSNVQDIRIVERIRHEKYTPLLTYHDIALLKLEKPVKMNRYVRPACLSLKDTVDPGEYVMAAGWGVIEFGDDKVSDDLLKVTLPLVSNIRCRKAYSSFTRRLPNGLDSASQICAGGVVGTDTCQGDSGGPLMVFNENEECMYDVIGITSFGQPCGFQAPSVYTKVYNYIEWIEKKVWPDVC